MDLKSKIRDIKDFPQEGIIFRDITTLLEDAEGLQEAIKLIEKELEGIEFDYVAGTESRGFIFGTPVAYSMKKGFIPVRKAGKLPGKTISKSYDLEYGKATIEIHEDALKKGDRVVFIDDLIATGGTAKAACQLMEEAGAEIVKSVFLIELEDLNGRRVLEKYNISSIVKY